MGDSINKASARKKSIRRKMLSYNALVQSWQEIPQRERASGTPAAQQERLF